MNSHHRLLAILAVCSVLLFGPQFVEQPLAQSRRTPPTNFKSGAERSEAVLKDISATLKQIDGRLARIERLASQAKVSER